MPRKKKIETIVSPDSKREIVAKLTKEDIYTPTSEELKEKLKNLEDDNEVIQTENVIEFQVDPELGVDGDVNFVSDMNLNIETSNENSESEERELTEEEKHELKILQIKMSHLHYHPKKVFDDKYRETRRIKNGISRKMRKINTRKK